MTATKPDTRTLGANTTSAKPTPPAKVAEYIATLKTPEERRYARKQWRCLAGHWATVSSLRGLTPERVKSTREGDAAAIA